MVLVRARSKVGLAKPSVDLTKKPLMWGAKSTFSCQKVCPCPESYPSLLKSEHDIIRVVDMISLEFIT